MSILESWEFSAKKNSKTSNFIFFNAKINLGTVVEKHYQTGESDINRNSNVGVKKNLW